MGREMTDSEAYVALNLMERIGPVSVRGLATACGSVRALMTESASALRSIEDAARSAVEALIAQRDNIPWEAELEKCAASGIRVLTPVDAEYPDALRQIHDPPLALYIKGGLLKRDSNGIAIVGTRRPSLYGNTTAERLAGGLARAGLTVVSGMAAGIDSAAHRGALDAGGRTIGVIGSGFRHFYPPENEKLAALVADGKGAVMSEFPLERVPDKTTFPMRNRIVSGISRGAVIVEASPRSGAMITARMALEQGRTVFAVPGRVDSARSRGPHCLLRDGAVLVESSGDILAEFDELPLGGNNVRTPAAGRVTMSVEELAIVEQLETEPMNIDALLRSTGLGVGKVHAALVSLEMKRVVRTHAGQVVALIDGEGK